MSPTPLVNAEYFQTLSPLVIVTSGSIDRKELYKPLRVPEVWFWKADRLRVFHLKEEYEEVSQSELLPDLDLAIAAKVRRTS